MRDTTAHYPAAAAEAGRRSRAAAGSAPSLAVPLPSLAGPWPSSTCSSTSIPPVRGGRGGLPASGGMAGAGPGLPCRRASGGYPGRVARDRRGASLNSARARNYPDNTGTQPRHACSGRRPPYAPPTVAKHQCFCRSKARTETHSGAVCAGSNPAGGAFFEYLIERRSSDRKALTCRNARPTRARSNCAPHSPPEVSTLRYRRRSNPIGHTSKRTVCLACNRHLT